MKKKLKKIIEGNKIFQLIYSLYYACRNEEYLDLICGINENPYIVLFKQGNKPKKNTMQICVIPAGGKNDGLFASVRWALDGLYFCDKFGFTPVIKFAEDSLYFDKDMPNQKNPFEYYFVQPFQISDNDIDKFPNVNYSARNKMMAENLNKLEGYQTSQCYIDEMATIMKKYLSFNDETKKIIDNAIYTRNINESTLGIHIRGTDYKQNCNIHPIYIEPETYYEYIDESISKYKFNKIFLATDDSEILQTFISHYGEEMVVYDKDVQRGTGNKGVHTSIEENKLFNKYSLGLEVICDMCSLAACGGIVSGLSQVSLVTRIYKKSQDQEFICDKIISLGINENKHNFSI